MALDLSKFKLVESAKEVSVGDTGVVVGGKKVTVMAGPCSVDDEESFLETARQVKEIGASVLRGGAFKPRTSPHSFQGLGIAGLEILGKAREETGLPVVTEVMDAADVKIVERHCDLLQVGTRNAQNFPLLKAVSKSRKPVLLKRGFGCTVEEWLFAAEYVLLGGNQVVLCERGIRTFENSQRFTLDLGSVAMLKEELKIPVVVDPSHSSGDKKLVNRFSKAAIGTGADGLLVDVHAMPERAKVDREQALLPGEFEILVSEVGRVAEAVGKTI
jgi:3-deoxy-7-phosphoheptulonate synthase